MKTISVAEVINAAEFDPKPPGFWAGFTWFSPAVAMLLSVTLYPTGMVLWLSVHRTGLYEVVDGVGLANYATVLTLPAFLELSLNSLLYVSGALALVLPMGTFNQICGEAFQRMILRDLAPAAAALEVRTRYADALAKS